SGSDEALVEGHFVEQSSEHVVSRTVSSNGRSRVDLDGRLSTASAIAELGEQFVDLYGQHAHQSLLRPAKQRHALDQFAGVDLTAVRELRARIGQIGDEIDQLGGDERHRAREVELLRFERDEIDEAAIEDAGEQERLTREEETLADAVALRTAA